MSNETEMSKHRARLAEACIELVEGFVDHVNEYPVVDGATPYYCSAAYGIAWSDEHVKFDSATDQARFDPFFLSLVSMRTGIIKGYELGAECEKLIRMVKERCSVWAYCQPNRFDPGLAPLCAELEAEEIASATAALAAWDRKLDR